VELVSRQGAP